MKSVTLEEQLVGLYSLVDAKHRQHIKRRSVEECTSMSEIVRDMIDRDIERVVDER